MTTIEENLYYIILTTKLEILIGKLHNNKTLLENRNICHNTEQN